MNFKTFKIGGIHPVGNKLTAGLPTTPIQPPKQVVIPLSQHIGAPAKPIVKRGDKVKVGTLIAEAGGFVSAPIHSSVSGTVAKIDNRYDASGYQKPAIIIDVEGDEWEETIDRTTKLETVEQHPELTKELILNKIKDAGIVGMGGAGFPTHVKLNPPQGTVIDSIVINAVECEPYITADHCLMMEHADEIIEGIKIILKATNAPIAYIGIEGDKPDAIKLLEEKTYNNPQISVVPLKRKYPQGGEKQLIDAVLGRRVPMPPAIPANVGVVVQNVATTFAIYEAVMKNKPLIERHVSVSGKQLSKGGNFLVRIGTLATELINNCGGLPDEECKLISGGPMMGKTLVSTDIPIAKTTNSILLIANEEAVRKNPSHCIRCAKCVGACPMGLEPYLIATLSASRQWDRAEDEDITSCIECGSCQYVCPAHIPILDKIRTGKATVTMRIKSRNTKKQS